MQKVRKVLVMALLCGFAKVGVAEQRYAVGLLVGTAEQTTEVSSGRDFSGDDVAVGIRGEYLFSQYAALELTYADFGEYADSFNPSVGTLVTENFGVEAMMLGGKLMWPIHDRFSVHARAGVARWELALEERVSNRSDTFSEKDTGTDLYYGVGVDVPLGERWRVSLEHTVLSFDAKIGMASIDEEVKTTSLAAAYRF